MKDAQVSLKFHTDLYCRFKHLMMQVKKDAELSIGALSRYSASHMN